VSGAELIFDVIVGLGPGVGVVKDQQYGSSRGFSFKNSGQDMDLIRLFPGGGDKILTRFPAIQLLLDILFPQF
jgi:hypothetical protein